ncbi:MAG: ABC transporter permease [Oscillospiraceae bacterium]|nr:ABC transporter permease [Oscillospiraceae bacterium]
MSDKVEAKTQDAKTLVKSKYKKRSQIYEIAHHMSKNKGAMAGLIILGIMVLLFIISLFISWEQITAINPHARFAPPSRQHWFGADNFGRDLFLRVIFGTRYTLAIGIGSVAFASIFGVTAGCFAGYYGGKVEDIIMRASDVIASIPGMLLGMVVVTVLGQSLQNLIIAVGVQSIPIYLRMTRASILSVRNQEFVEAAKSIGLSNTRIIFTQVLPNGLAPIFVTVTASLGISIIVASSLSYLGFGVPVPHPEWGAIISGAKEFARLAPNLMLFPGIFIMVTVLAFNLLGDGLRDALDPKLKK